MEQAEFRAELWANFSATVNILKSKIHHASCKTTQDKITYKYLSKYAQLRTINWTEEQLLIFYPSF